LSQQAKEAQDAWIEMWQETAKQFKDEPNVIGYDLMVEPLTTTEQRKSPKGMPIEKQIEKWHRLACCMACAIRAEDKKTPILIGGAPYNAAETLSYLPAKDYVSFDPVVFTVNQYKPSEYSEEQEKQVEYSKDYRCDLLAAYKDLAKFANQVQQAITISEFGAVRWAGADSTHPDAHKFLAEQLALIEKQGCNHAIWMWEADKIDWNNPFQIRWGVNKDNDKCDAPDTDPLVKTIKDNWKTNRLFATPELLRTLKHCP
jgi:hypothetical protein